MTPVSRTLVLLAFLVCAPFASAIEVSVSSVEYGPADLEQSYPALATNGDIFLAVWSNAVWSSGNSHREVHAARITRAGQVLDTPAIRLVAAPRTGGLPRVAWTGRYFLVAWTSHPATYLTRIDADGRILGEQVFEGTSATSLTCHSTRCLLTVIAGAPWELTLQAIVLDSDGTVIQQKRVAGPLFASTFHAETATDGDGFLVTWSSFDSNNATQRYRLSTAAVTANGNVGTVRPLPISGAIGSDHAVVSDGTSYLLSWVAGTHIFSQRFSRDGTDIGGGPPATLLGLVPYAPLRLLKIPSGYLVISMSGTSSRLVSRTLRPDFTPSSDWQTISDAYPSSGFDAAIAAGQILVAWTETAAAGSDLYARIVNGAEDRFSVSQSARSQRQPAAAWDGQRLLTVWEETVSGHPQIRMSLLRGAESLEYERFVHRGDADGDQIGPQVAFNGTEYLIVWEERFPMTLRTSTLRGMRFSKTGEPLQDSPVILTSTPCGNSAVASNGRDFLVSWTDCASGVVASRIISGIVADRVLITPPAATAVSGAVAWDGRSYVVTWLDQQPPQNVSCVVPCFVSTVRASRLDASGELHDSAALSVPNLAGSAPRAVWNGEFVLVVWVQGFAIHGARLRPDGTAEPSRPLVIGNASFLDPSLTWTGSLFVLAWESGYDGRGIMTTAISTKEIDAGIAVMANALLPTGDGARRPVVTTIGEREVAVSYQRLASDYGTANRVFVRTLTLGGRRRSVGR